MEMKEHARFYLAAKLFAVVPFFVLLTMTFNAVGGEDPSGAAVSAVSEEVSEEASKGEEASMSEDSSTAASEETSEEVSKEEETSMSEDSSTADAAKMLPGSYGLEKMIVTATRRESDVQDLAFSVNVQSEEDLQRLNTANIEELANNVAGLSIQNLGPGQSVVNIRGVSSGQIVRDQPGVKEQVGVYLDETPISLSLFTPDLDLFDLNRVETLRGPQGTLFGAGSIGGTVRYITNQPELGVVETKSEVDMNLVGEDSFGGHLKTAFNVPLGETAALRMVAYGTKYAGFIDALRETGGMKENVNDGRRFGGRLALLFKPTDSISITPRIVYQNIDMNGFNRDEVFNLYANPYTKEPRTPIQLGKRQQHLLLDEAFEDKTLIMDTTAKLELDPVSVSYMFSYTNRDILVSRDASALAGSVSVNPLAFADEAVLLPSNLRDTTDLKQMTHEVHFSSNNESMLQWLGGVFYSNTDRDYGQRLPTPGYDVLIDGLLGKETHDGLRNGFPDTDAPYVSDLTYDLRQVALFGESTLTLLDRLDLTAGLRWYDWKEDKTFKSGGVFSNSDAQNQEVTTKSNGFAPRFMANYKVTDQIAVNAQASRGFRLGGVNDPLNALLCGNSYDTFRKFQTFEDETLWNYEFGFKSSFEPVTLNASVFYTDIKNLGVNVDAGSCSSRVTISVPEAHTLGSELELSAQPTDSLLFTFAGSYVQAEFDSTITDTTATGGDNALLGIKKGNRLPSVPDWQLSASATYTFPGILKADEGYVTAAWQYVGSRITQPGDQVEGAGTFTHNLHRPAPNNTRLPGLGGLTGDETTTVDLVLDPYYLINLSTGLMYKNLEFMLYVKNLTDKNVQLSFDRERGGRARLAYRVGQPRTFGLVTRMYF